MDEAQRVSVIIPARNSEALIAHAIEAVRNQRCPGVDVEIIVVDDGSVDNTSAVAQAAGARTITIDPAETEGNPAAARNRGAALATGDPIIFIDDDCTPAEGWLEALLNAHARGATCVGGSLARPPGLPVSARLDYYCGWYHVHPRCRAGPVPNHPPGNLSVRRAAFSNTCGFSERKPLAYAHEELEWQAELQRKGTPIYFEPKAKVYHRNRPGFGNLLRRNYRWAYSSIEAKAQTGAARMAWLYRYPRLLIAAAAPLALAQSAYIVICWVRAGVFEPLLLFPAVVVARLAYAAGMVVGGLRWLHRRKTSYPPVIHPGFPAGSDSRAIRGSAAQSQAAEGGEGATRSNQRPAGGIEYRT
jgi:glycosyltransferase involved in cell wall biosynthesis